MNGQAVLAHSPIFPNTWAYYDNIEKLDYDPDQAIKMLREAGYVIPAEGGDVRSKDGLRLSFELVHLDDPIHTQIAEMIQENWNAVGVDVDLVAVDEATLMDDYLNPRDYQAALVDLTLARTPDPDPYPFWHQAQRTNGQNYSMWDDRRGSEYIEQARVTANRQERLRLYRNFQVHFNREMPALPLFYPMYTYAVDEEVGGISLGPIFDPSDRFANIIEWFLVARPGVQGVEGATETP
jgi:peptide/nickel transport system substrate-binding protein